MDNARIRHVHGLGTQLGCLQAVQCQGQHLQIGLQAGVAINLGTELQWLARSVGAARAGMQYRAAIAKPGDPRAVQQMGINARHLRCAVGPQAHHAS